MLGVAIRAMSSVLVLVVVLAGCATDGPPDNVPATSPPPAPGGSEALDSVRALRGESLEFTVYTYGPGDAVFERFGHIALSMRDMVTGEDVAFNWGMFDFNQPRFLMRFLTGDTRYWMAGFLTPQFNAVYRSDDRTIRRQTLALTPLQRGALHDFLLWNAQEENRYYRYDYYRDNCSTRVRDVLDWALGGELKSVLRGNAGQRTWREETARITADNLPVYAGIEIALGRNADRPLDAWDEAFLPDLLADRLAAVTVNGEPLVEGDSVIFAAVREPIPIADPSRLWAATLLGLAASAVILLLSRASSGDAFLSLVGVVWYALGGILGTTLLLAGTVTRHAPYMGSNLTLLLLNPLLIVAAVCWPLRVKSSRAGKASLMLAHISALFGVLALIFGWIPGFTQHNMVVVAAILPVHVALAVAAGPCDPLIRLLRRSRADPASGAS